MSHIQSRPGVLSEFVPLAHSPSFREADPRFDAYPQELALEFFDEMRQGVPLRITTDPWIGPDDQVLDIGAIISGCGASDAESMIGEGEVPDPCSDFRDSITDTEAPRFEACNGELVARHCTWEWVQKLQRFGCSCIVLIAEGLYDLFFPVEFQEELLLA